MTKQCLQGSTFFEKLINIFYIEYFKLLYLPSDSQSSLTFTTAGDWGFQFKGSQIPFSAYFLSQSSTAPQVHSHCFDTSKHKGKKQNYYCWIFFFFKDFSAEEKMQGKSSFCCLVACFMAKNKDIIRLLQSICVWSGGREVERKIILIGITWEKLKLQFLT